MSEEDPYLSVDQATHCDCGEPLHYSNVLDKIIVSHLIELLGPCVRVEIGECAWMVPRHYIALHGVKGIEVPDLAQRYGWERVK